MGSELYVFELSMDSCALTITPPGMKSSCRHGLTTPEADMCRAESLDGWPQCPVPLATPRQPRPPHVHGALLALYRTTKIVDGTFIGTVLGIAQQMDHVNVLHFKCVSPKEYQSLPSRTLWIAPVM